uniref:transcription initiation factor TFIID subunit 7 n=1 Tax=Epinephelus lanceolatus TaxID=310571 RepID=UPI0014470702|nr:transcription initiation factor TFIID subunit 7 [Epinephelus lanceolatus]
MTSKLKAGKVGSKNKEDAPYELESQFILRLPTEYASTVRRIAQSSSMNMKDRLTIELHPDGRHGIVRVDRVPLACKLVDLPCMIESLKTVDKKTFYKTADVCQMLVCTLDGDLYPPLEEPTGTDPKSKKKDKDKDKKFVWNHGITCPLKNTRKRRFRKTAKKKYIESPDVEKEVKRLLSTDAEAVSVRTSCCFPAVMEYQVQINGIKAKLQETRARKKQQEELIMKVENQALKNRFQALLDEIIQQEEREMEQLASLQEQLDSLIEK